MSLYELHCKCGQSSIKIDIEADEFKIMVQCAKCNRVIFRRRENQNVAAQIEAEHKLNPAGATNAAQATRADSSTTTPKKQDANQFDHYTIMQKLGEGGMAAIYRAVDNRNQEQVALKIFKKADTEKALKYIEREVQILLKLDHPNIVTLKGAGQSRGYQYFAMEYIEGNDLETLIKAKRLRPVDAIQALLYIIEALTYASQFRVIHRDIKPANIVISNTGIVKLIDMGIGKIVEDSEALTKTGEIMGTAYYMPPEQLRDAKRTDFRADIYALGATLYHALCGTPPFCEYGKLLNKLVFAKISNNYVPLRKRNPDLPEQLYQIVEKAMGYRLEDRYGSLLDMKKEWMAAYQSLRSK